MLEIGPRSPGDWILLCFRILCTTRYDTETLCLQSQIWFLGIWENEAKIISCIVGSMFAPLHMLIHVSML